MKSSRLAVLAGALVLAAAFGCGDDDETGRPTFGTVTVRLTDAPAQYDQVNIVVTGIHVLRGVNEQSGTWETIDDETFTVDLIQLRNGVIQTIGSDQVPEGTYSQIRLMIGEGSTVVVDGVSHPLTIPSGMSSGLKLMGNFTVTGGATSEILLDWDASRSIHRTGSGTYILNPVVRVIPNSTSTTGRISGRILPAGLDNTVYAIQGTDTVTSAFPGTTGQFTLSALPPGSYSVAVAADSGYRDTTLTGVSVTVGNTTSVGDVQLQAE